MISYIISQVICHLLVAIACKLGRLYCNPCKRLLYFQMDICALRKLMNAKLLRDDFILIVFLTLEGFY